ncbi:MAG: BrnT family toxin [Okeania sp. SIO3C4]|nr:BrnT family toxin [Okeania sp. SIO3C4]
MKFEWDENKNKKNLDKHFVSFEQAKEVFNDKKRIEQPDIRKDYGEPRIKVIGKAKNLMLSVIYTMRGAVARLISARSASRNERKDYDNKNEPNNGKQD